MQHCKGSKNDKKQSYQVGLQHNTTTRCWSKFSPSQTYECNFQEMQQTNLVAPPLYKQTHLIMTYIFNQFALQSNQRSLSGLDCAYLQSYSKLQFRQRIVSRHRDLCMHRGAQYTIFHFALLLRCILPNAGGNFPISSAEVVFVQFSPILEGILFIIQLNSIIE